MFIELHCANIYIQQPFTPNLFTQLFPNSTMLCSFSCSFERCTLNCGTRSHTSKPQGLISANFSVCISVIKFQTREFALRKHQYSASVCAKSDFPIVPKLNYMVQSCMLFLMMYGKLGHKLTNVKTARINKLLIAFVHRITLRKHLYSVTVTPNLFTQLFLNSTMLCSFSCSFQRCTENCGTSSQTSKSQGLISANYSVCIYY